MTGSGEKNIKTRKLWEPEASLVLLAIFFFSSLKGRKPYWRAHLCSDFHFYSMLRSKWSLSDWTLTSANHEALLPFDLGWDLWSSFVKLVSFQETPASSTAWWTPIPVVSFLDSQQMLCTGCGLHLLISIPQLQGLSSGLARPFLYVLVTPCAFPW